MSENEALKVIKDLISGLMYLHQNLIIHRDIKPDNMLIIGTKEKWKVVIIDFNITKRIGFEKQTEYCGTPGFIAPEIIKTEKDSNIKYSYEADIYSLGRFI